LKNQLQEIIDTDNKDINPELKATTDLTRDQYSKEECVAEFEGYSNRLDQELLELANQKQEKEKI